MKVENKKIAIIISCVLVVLLGGAGIFAMLNNSNSKKAENYTEESGESLNKSSIRPKQTKKPNGNTHYIKDYVGRNAKNTCSWRFDKSCRDDYGKAPVLIKFETDSGEEVVEANVSNFKVVNQSIDPDSEIVVEKGEYGSYKSDIEEITLTVETVDKNKKLVEVEKTTEMYRYQCSSKKGEVLSIVENSSFGGADQDTVKCKYLEKVLK